MAKKNGRPSKKNTISLKQVEKLATYALTDVQIADILEICEATLNNYKRDSTFLEALKKGKEKADNYVVGSLFHRAIGYSHPELQLFQYKGKIVKAMVMKHYPPDTLSAIFWLKNRQPEKWRDKTEIDHMLKEYLYEDISTQTPKELESMANELRARRLNGSKNRTGAGIPAEGKSA